jgi:hypothetical protein
MGIFSRKKDTSIPQYEPVFPEIKHEHTWNDMPWYMEISYNTSNKTASYEIIEPYICVTCGERNDKILEKTSWTGISAKARDEEYEKVRKLYSKYLKPKAVVEDMINNILLVKDPEHLEMVENMRGTPHKRCGTSAEMKQVFQ